MANYAEKKQRFSEQMIETATALINLKAAVDWMNAAYSVNAFQSGGVNEFEDADFSVENVHLTAAIVSNAMFAIGIINTAFTEGVLNSLLSCLPGAIPKN